MKGLRYRSDYAQTDTGFSELGRLINDTFEIDISPLNRLGHDPSIIAFGWWHEERLVANVSLYERQFYLDGNRVFAFGVQSVAVRPDWRGKGLFRDLMLRALRYADTRAELVILVTGTPELYKPFGFRQLHETIFSAELTLQNSTTEYRDLSLDAAEDVSLLRDIFSRRVPTSLLAAACDHPSLFFLRAVLTPDIRLVYLPALDAVAALRTTREALVLMDVVAAKIPTLEDILANIGFGRGRVDVHFTPDRLGWKPQRQHRVDNGYMVRGAFAPEGQAFMLSDMRV
ncbi:GNAT family N-acetyltransferase [Nitratireductor indicus]|uniref:Acetyltransferase n=1 Tax=Nitratireductor indicus C115 TaxID=1231190 RepID=K2NUE6_9HYPH|nr:GNAT family N-acetyltransferase [Nitratireductor indicus]EKF42985.1 acetyltransferase [Nitratireductor indicus C115]MDS1137866.1 GNAT family N-acetyltransferase [Nitratireductor indicus]SFQ51716.1 Acetyltransferase (GNAT) domain-containing protein [Nitratireductor indicus]